MITLRIDDIPSSNNKYIGRDASFTNIRLILEAEFGKDKGTEIIVKARD